MKNILATLAVAGIGVLAVPALASASGDPLCTYVAAYKRGAERVAAHYHDPRTGWSCTPRAQYRSKPKRRAHPSYSAPRVKWYTDRDGNLAPRPAVDDPYLDAWLDDYFRH